MYTLLYPLVYASYSLTNNGLVVVITTMETPLGEPYKHPMGVKNYKHYFCKQSSGVKRRVTGSIVGYAAAPPLK